MTPTGQTADGRWEIGVRRTFAGLAVDEAWRAALDLVAADPALGATRSRTDGEVARFAYREPEWPRDSTLQVRTLAAATGTTIAIHHEGLPDEAIRERMRQQWTRALERIGSGT